MTSVTWCSSWAASSTDEVSVQLLPDARGGVATLPALPLCLTRPDSPATSVPCEVSIQWDSEPLRCLQLELHVLCSARHVELYAQGTRRSMLGEEEQGESYLGTFRGVKQEGNAERQLFAMKAPFRQSDRDCDVLKSLQTLRVKFVSLTGDRNALSLHELRCVFVPMEPAASVDTSGASLSATMGVAGAAPDVQMMLKAFQQTLERDMETKIARAVDAKLATLSQRLAFSEQALFQLHKKMDAKDAHVQASLGQIQHKFSQLEAQLSQFSAVNEAEESKTEDNESPGEGEVKSTEQRNNAEADDEELKETGAASE